MRPFVWLSDESFECSSLWRCRRGGKKNPTAQDVFGWYSWFMAFPFWFIILIYPIWKGNRWILSDRLFCFCVKKILLANLKEVLSARAYFSSMTQREAELTQKLVFFCFVFRWKKEKQKFFPGSFLFISEVTVVCQFNLMSNLYLSH